MMGIKFEEKIFFFFVDFDIECYGDCGIKVGGWRYFIVV